MATMPTITISMKDLPEFWAMKADLLATRRQRDAIWEAFEEATRKETTSTHGSIGYLSASAASKSAAATGAESSPVE